MSVDQEQIATLLGDIFNVGLCDGPHALGTKQKVVFFVTAIEVELAMSGISALYTQCSSGVHAPAIADALDEVGLLECAQLMRKANATVCPNGFPDDEDKLRELYDSLDEEQQKEVESLGDLIFDFEISIHEKRNAYIVTNFEELRRWES